jgi:hypothetical protein
MPFPQGPFAKSRIPRPRPETKDVSYVFGVGSLAFISEPGGKGPVALSDQGGTVAVGHLEDGAQVEILAWRPRRAATLYCVQATESRIEGWLGVANLRKTREPAPAAAPALAK